MDICTGQKRGIYRAKPYPLATTTGGPMTPLDIALSLTLQQRDALCGFYSWNSPIEQEEGEAELYRLGLWHPKPKYHEGIITPLGKEVRNHIKKANAR